MNQNFYHNFIIFSEKAHFSHLYEIFRIKKALSVYLKVKP
jgi:hypothetical protein